MRELEGTGIVHRSDSECNPDIQAVIKDAKLARDPRAYIDLLNGAKPIEYAVKASNDGEKQNQSKIEIPETKEDLEHEENIEEMER